MKSTAITNHVVVTPCRDPQEIFSLIDSITGQTIPPTEFIIVLHNHTDLDQRKIYDYTRGIDWISITQVIDSTERRRGAQIAKIVNFGISKIRKNWAFLSKIDADMVLESDYFEQIFEKFKQNEKLGITSGSCYLIERGLRVPEKVSLDHTRGGLKTYRKQCFDEIGGIREVDGWDAVDNIAANMAGWETSNHEDIQVFHKRRTGSHNGLISGCFETGKFAYALRYYFPFMLARSIHRMLGKPYMIGGLSMLIGYFHAAASREPQSLTPLEKKYLVKKQRRKILSLVGLYEKDS